MGDAEKIERTKKKRAVTKQINYVKQLMAEGETTDSLNEEVTSLKKLFKEFSTAHDGYHDTLEMDDDIDESEVYFNTVQGNYIELLSSFKAHTINENASDAASISSSRGSDDLT